MLKDTFPQIRFKKEGNTPLLFTCCLHFLFLIIWRLFYTIVDWPRQAKNRDGYWKDTDTRRKFLLDFAKKMNFDPLVASSWAKQRGNLLATPGVLIFLQQTTTINLYLTTYRRAQLCWKYMANTVCYWRILSLNWASKVTFPFTSL